jgi:hypothetical protein
MLRSRIQREDFTVPKHSALANEMNELIIAIKLHYTIDASKENPETLAKARGNAMKPTWEYIEQFLTNARNELNNDRIDPIRRRYAE